MGEKRERERMTSRRRWRGNEKRDNNFFSNIKKNMKGETKTKIQKRKDTEKGRQRGNSRRKEKFKTERKKILERRRKTKEDTHAADRSCFYRLSPLPSLPPSLLPPFTGGGARQPGRCTSIVSQLEKVRLTKVL